MQSVAVVVTLEWAIRANIDVISLLLGEDGEVGTKGRKVQLGNLLIQTLGQEVHVVLVCLVGGVVPVQINLGKSLIGEGARHDERWVASGAAKVEETARGQHNHT